MLIVESIPSTRLDTVYRTMERMLVSGRGQKDNQISELARLNAMKREINDSLRAVDEEVFFSQLDSSAEMVI